MYGMIHVPADRVWAYYKRYQDELVSSQHLIAEWPEFGIEVYIMDEDGHAGFTVYADESVVYENEAADRDECESIADIIYDTYMTPDVIEALQPQPPEEEPEPGETAYDLVDKRETELDIALSNFLEEVLTAGELDENPDAIDPSGELFGEIKNYILEFLGCDIGYRIYRPTICTGPDGKDRVEDYPYELYDHPSVS